jgi:hypothetical protein
MASNSPNGFNVGDYVRDIRHPARTGMVVAKQPITSFRNESSFNYTVQVKEAPGGFQTTTVFETEEWLGSRMELDPTADGPPEPQDAFQLWAQERIQALLQIVAHQDEERRNLQGLLSDAETQIDRLRGFTP